MFLPPTHSPKFITTTTFHTTSIVLLSIGKQQGYQVGLGVGIPVSVLLTTIISSLVASFITYLCLNKGSCHKSTPPVQEPVYDPVSSGTSVEMKSNVAYGQVTTGGHVTYETVPQ